MLRTHPLTERRIEVTRERLPQLQAVYQRNRAQVAAPPRIGVDEAAARYLDPLGRYTFPCPMTGGPAGAPPLPAPPSSAPGTGGSSSSMSPPNLPAGATWRGWPGSSWPATRTWSPASNSSRGRPPAGWVMSRPSTSSTATWTRTGGGCGKASFLALKETTVYLFQYADAPERFETTAGDFFRAAEAFTYR